jgi:hypothetical protein
MVGVIFLSCFKQKYLMHTAMPIADDLVSVSAVFVP